MRTTRKRPASRRSCFSSGAQFQADDVAGGTRRTARVRRSNRAAAFAWHVRCGFMPFAFRPGTLAGGGLRSVAPETSGDGGWDCRAVCALALRSAMSLGSRCSLAAPGLFLRNIESHASSPSSPRSAGAGANSIEV